MKDETEDIVIPIINIKSIIEEREIIHEEALHQIVLDMVELMDIKTKIELALDKGEEHVIIDLPGEVQKPLYSTFMGKIRFLDVFRNFAFLLEKEGYPFSFESSYTGGCCFYPEDMWEETDVIGWGENEVAYALAVKNGVAICGWCEKAIHLKFRDWEEPHKDRSNHLWRLITKENQELHYTTRNCCRDLKIKQKEYNLEADDVSLTPPCRNCLNEFWEIREKSKTKENQVLTKLKIEFR